MANGYLLSIPANSFTLSAQEQASDYNISMPFGKPKREKKKLNEAELFDYAVKALGRRMRTEAELRKLLEKQVEANAEGFNAIRNVETRLREYGYLNDQSYAETYARLRKENEKFGQRRVMQDMRQKGLSDSLITETIDSHYGNTDEAALARQHIARKRLKPPTNDKETARIVRRLIAAGFSLSTIRRVLSEWHLPDETLEHIESIELNSFDEGDGE